LIDGWLFGVKKVGEFEPPLIFSIRSYMIHMDVSENTGYPQKWMVKIMENPIKMDDLGVPLFLETSIYDSYDTLSLFKTISSI